MLSVLMVLSSLGAWAAPTALAADCPVYEFVGARGSGETGDYDDPNTQGLGTLLADAYGQLSAAQPGRVRAYAVHYPAVSVKDGVGGIINGAGAFLHIKPLGSYTDSVRAGTSDMLSHIRAVRSVCSGTKFILGGYSQGAQAVGDALTQLSADERSSVAGAMFFGDPLFNAHSWSSRSSVGDHFGLLGVRGEWPDDMYGKIFSYCRPHDPICGISKEKTIFGHTIYYRDFPWFRGFDPHGQYPSSGDVTDAVKNVSALLGTGPTAPGSDVPLDLVFAIDTTGSMGGTIDQVKTNVKALTEKIAQSSPSSRFAIVDYKDDGDEYQARTDLDFTTDTAGFQTAADSLEAFGGGDYPESVYSGVMQGLNLAWRPEARKVVIPIGDAPGKDPEPGTGYTLQTVRDKAASLATAPRAATTRIARTLAATTPAAGEAAKIYPIATSDNSDTTAFMNDLAEGTGGKLTVAPDPDTFVPTLMQTITSAATAEVAPTADAGGPYTGTAGAPVTFSGGGSRIGSAPITRYEWDFDGDGTFETTTPNPTTQHTFTDTGSRTVGLRISTASGLASTATATVDVAAAPAAPGMPTELVAKPSNGQIELTWKRGAGGAPLWYTITDGSGALLERVGAAEDGSPAASWIDTGLVNGSSQSYRVSAGNDAGESALSAPATAVVGTAPVNQPPTATDDAYSTDNTTPLVVPMPGVLANDTDPNPADTLTAKTATTPRSGTLSLAPDGSLTYTPRAGFVGTDTFTYTALDNHGATSKPAKVTVTVTAPSTARQRVAFVGSGRPPMVAVGPVTTGSFTVAQAGLLVQSVTGSGTVALPGGKTALLSVDIRRGARGWQGVMTVKTPDGTTTYNGTGAVGRAGRLTVSGFTGNRQAFGFVLTDLPTR